MLSTIMIVKKTYIPKEDRTVDGFGKIIEHVFMMWTCFCQGRNLAGADSDLEETSEVEEEQDFPTIASGSESSIYGLTKKKKRRPKEKKEKNPRKKRDDDDDDDDDEDGTMKVSLGLALQVSFSGSHFIVAFNLLPS